MAKTKKLLWMKWYPNDWINDTRELSPEAKAAWIDILCLMWNSPKRGVWEGSHQEFARATGLPWEIAPRIIQELSHKASRVTFSDTKVTLENRRMVNQETIYKSHAKRQDRYRKKHKCDAKVTNKTSQDVSRLLKTTTNTLPQAAKRKTFIKPTAGELTAYGASIGYGLDPHKFLDHYEANGWKVGKTAMADWKATVRKWKANGNSFESGAVSVKAAVLPKYKENVPPPDEVLSAADIAAMRGQIGAIGMTAVDD